MHTIPIDDALPALRIGAEQGFETVLAACGIDEPINSVRALRHHPGKRCTLEVRLATRRVALKVFRKDPGILAKRLCQLAGDGLAKERGPSVTVLLGYGAELRCVVTAWLEGPNGEALVSCGKGDRLATLVGRWTEAACSLRPGDLPRYDAKAMLDDLFRWQCDIQLASALLGQQVAVCIKELAGNTIPHGSQGLIHGSFAHLHVIDLGEGPGVLDWDEPRYGPVELDLGGMLASLKRHALLHPGDAQSADRAAAAIIADASDQAAVDWFYRAALVKQAKHMCKLRKDGWHAMADGLLSTIPHSSSRGASDILR